MGCSDRDSDDEEYEQECKKRRKQIAKKIYDKIRIVSLIEEDAKNSKLIKDFKIKYVSGSKEVYGFIFILGEKHDYQSFKEDDMIYVKMLEEGIIVHLERDGIMQNVKFFTEQEIELMEDKISTFINQIQINFRSLPIAKKSTMNIVSLDSYMINVNKDL
jgi:hypothetical protein